MLRKKKPEGRSQRGDDACSLLRGTQESAAVAASVGMSHWKGGFHGGNLWGNVHIETLIVHLGIFWVQE